jgi:hypothetical protein
MRQTFAIGIGGAAGQGVATPGDIFAKIFSRRGRFKTLSSITNSTGHGPFSSRFVTGSRGRVLMGSLSFPTGRR